MLDTGSHALFVVLILLSIPGFGAEPPQVSGDAVTLPADERHRRATFELLTGYMPPAFRTFHVLQADDTLAELSPGPGEQTLPVIASTADGSHAMAAWSPAVAHMTGQPATYGRFWFEQEQVAKRNCVVREEVSAEDPQAMLAAGSYRYLIWVAVGTREQVRDTLGVLRKRAASEMTR